MVNTLVYQGITSLENGMFSTPPERLGFRPSNAGQGEAIELEYPEAKQEIEEGLHKLETLLEATVDKNFDKFEIYVLRSVLAMPTDLTNWIRLSHYEVGRYLLLSIVVLKTLGSTLPITSNCTLTRVGTFAATQVGCLKDCLKGARERACPQ